jgi:hypothetical protein
MPAAVLAVFFALNRVHHQQRGSAAPPAAVPGEGGTPRQL